MLLLLYRPNNFNLHLLPQFDHPRPPSKVKLCTAKFSNAYKVAAHAQSFLRYAWTRGAMRMALNLWREEVSREEVSNRIAYFFDKVKFYSS